MMRSGYTAVVRPFKDSNVTAKIKWIRCQPGAPVLGFESAFQPLRWEANPELAGGVGEVFNEPQPFDPGLPIPGAMGQKVCGTEDEFKNGAVYDPDAPPVEYTPEGLALCCSSPPGGLEIGGAAVVPGAGGVSLGGFAGVLSPWYFGCEQAKLFESIFEGGIPIMVGQPYGDANMFGATAPGGFWRAWQTFYQDKRHVDFVWHGVGGGTGTVKVYWSDGACPNVHDPTALLYSGPLNDDFLITLTPPTPLGYQIFVAQEPEAGKATVFTMSLTMY
jgi:hypothetical protein